MRKNRKKIIILLIIVIAVICGTICYYKIDKGKEKDGLSDDEIYERLKICFNREEDEIQIIQQLNGNWSGWKLICGYNGLVKIEPEQISLSQIGDYPMIFTVTMENDKGESITKEYEKIIKVVGAHPLIVMKEKEIILNLNEEFVKDQWYEVRNLDDWILKVECDVDTSKMGKYRLTVSVTNPKTKESLQEEMIVNVIDKSLSSDGCALIWVVDKEEIAEKGHYETIEVEEVGHWEVFIVSDEEGHYETVHHEEIYHIEPEGEEFYWYNFYDVDKHVRNVISSYELDEMNMTIMEYINYLGDWVYGFYTKIDWRQTGSHKVVDQEAWDEEVYVIDKPAVYEERYVVDVPAYSYRIWVVDVPKQNEVGHWENKCN